MMTNVAVRVGTETVEIRLKLPTADRTRRHLDVLVNQKYYFFDNKQTYWQDFKSKFNRIYIGYAKSSELNQIVLLQLLGCQVLMRKKLIMCHRVPFLESATLHVVRFCSFCQRLLCRLYAPLYIYFQ